MLNHNRHLLLPSVITKTQGLVAIGSRAATLEKAMAVASPARNPSLATKGIKVEALARPYALGAVAKIHPRPFSTAHSGLDILPIPKMVLGKIQSFYDAVNILGASPPLPGLEYMGWGYNVFGTYAEPSQLKWPLFDLNAQQLVACAHPYDMFKTFDFVLPTPPLLTTMTNSFYGKTASEYLTSMSIRAGLTGAYNGFFGSISTDYNQVERTSSTNMFFRTRTIVGEMALHLDVAKFKYALSQEAKADLDGSLNPRDVFDKYGGYFLSGIVVGGKAYRTWTANRYDFSSTTTVQADAEVSFMKLIGLNGGVTSQSSAHFEAVAVSDNLTTIGGDPELGGGRLLEPGGFDRWMDSVSENMAFVDFTDPMVWHPLTPIWDLCSSDTRRNQLESAWETYASEQQREINPVATEVDYGIGIRTSTRDDAGTDADVSVELIGQDGRRSGLLHIGNNPRLFERGSQDYFVKSAMDVGELAAIRLAHDNTGDKPGWFVDTVRITCRERLWEFAINHWIAKSEAPKRTDITFDRQGNIIG